jgi:hypothetical protein
VQRVFICQNYEGRMKFQNLGYQRLDVSSGNESMHAEAPGVLADYVKRVRPYRTC